VSKKKKRKKQRTELEPTRTSGFSERERLEMAMTVYEEKEKGEDDSDIMDLLGIDAEEYAAVLSLMFGSKADEERRRTPEEHYVRYCLEQKKVVKSIDDLVENLNEKTQYNAIVGALRLKSDIIDKMKTTSQEFGIVKKTADRKDVRVGVFSFEGMSTKEVRKHVANELGQLQGFVEKFGDGDIRLLPEASLYYGPGTKMREEDEKRSSESAKPVAKVKKGSKKIHGRRRAHA